MVLVIVAKVQMLLQLVYWQVKIAKANTLLPWVTEQAVVVKEKVQLLSVVVLDTIHKVNTLLQLVLVPVTVVASHKANTLLQLVLMLVTAKQLKVLSY
jgi:hypothetical protein